MSCERLESRTLLATLVGGEFVVNHTTLGDQFNASAAMDPAGELVVAFNSFGQDGDQNGVFVRRFAAAGPARDTLDLAVNTTTTGNQLFPDIDIAANGDFVVVWESEGQDGDGSGVLGRRFLADGTPAGNEFQVNTTTEGGQFFANVAVADDGRFVVVWDSLGPSTASRGVFGQRFNADGTPAGSEFRINQTIDGGQFFPDVAADGSGEFVVAWEQQHPTTDQISILTRRFDAQGNAISDEVPVGSSGGDQQFPAVSMNDTRGFTVAWAEATAGGQHVLSRRFDASSQPLTAAATHTSETLTQIVVPTLAENAAGDLIVAWNQQLSTGSDQDIAATIVRSSGAVEAHLIVNTTTTGEQRFPTVAFSTSDELAVAWNSFGQDGSNEGIIAQRLRLNQSAQLDLNGPANAGNDFAANFPSASPAIPIVAADMVLTDADGPPVQFVTAQLSGVRDGSLERLLVDVGATGITSDFDEQTGVLLLNGPAAAADFQEVLRTLRYENTTANATPGLRSVEIVANDSLSNSSPVTAEVNVTAAPMNGSIGGQVFVDANNDGVRDPHEIGLPNVPVHLVGPVTRTVVTSADGTYLFEDLPAGNYNLSQTQPGAFLDGIDIVGDMPATVADDEFLGIALDAGMDIRGFHFGERSLRAELISKRFYLASTPAVQTILTQISLDPTWGWYQLASGISGKFAVTTSSETPAKFEVYNSQFMPTMITTTGTSTTIEMAEGESYYIYLPDADAEVEVQIERLPDPLGLHTWQSNPYLRFDVNNDGSVSPLDALQVINALNAPTRPLPADNVGLYLDVSGDEHLSALDVLLLFNELNHGRELQGDSEEIALRMNEAVRATETNAEDQIVKSGIQQLLPQLELAHAADHQELAAQLRRRIIPADTVFRHGDDDWRWDIETLIDAIVR